MNRLMKQACPTVKLLRSESGKLMTEDSNIMMQWQENCERLYSSSEGIEKMRMGGNKEPTPSVEEVKKALKGLKTAEAAWPDKVPVKLLKLSGDTITLVLHRIIQITWETGK